VWSTAKNPDPGAEMLRIGPDRAEGLGRRAKEDAGDRRFVRRGDGRDLVGHGEDDGELLAVEDLGPPALDPCGARQRLTLRAVPVCAGVIRDALVATGVARLDMAAARSGAARLDRGHDARLRARRRHAGVSSIGVARAAEDVRHFERRAIHGAAA
jgi:hypothetical protein